MKIKCPHCKNTYVIDHVELRDREKCPKCNKVIFVELFKKPFDKEGTSSIKKLLYGGTTAALVILAQYCPVISRIMTVGYSFVVL